MKSIQCPYCGSRAASAGQGDNAEYFHCLRCCYFTARELPPLPDYPLPPLPEHVGEQHPAIGCHEH